MLRKFTVTMFAALFALSAQAELVDAPNADLVRGHCSACHSLNLVTAQRGDRDFWLKTIRWMQRTQNLWPIPPQQEEAVLDYLAQNYAESEWGRRPNLSPLLMPAGELITDPDLPTGKK